MVKTMLIYIQKIQVKLDGFLIRQGKWKKQKKNIGLMKPIKFGINYQNQVY